MHSYLDGANRHFARGLRFAENKNYAVQVGLNPVNVLLHRLMSMSDTATLKMGETVMRKSSICALIVAVVLSFSIRAGAAEATPEQQAAAMAMLKTMHMEQTMSDAIGQMLDLQIKQNPAMEPLRQTMLDFLAKYMSFDAIKDDLAKIYGEEFTLSELNEMTAFYKTPAGQKMASKASILMSKGAALGQRNVQEHMGELQESIKAAAAKNAK